MEIIGDSLKAWADTHMRVPAFRAQWPWIGGDLQTVANTVRPPRIHYPSAARQHVAIEAGQIALGVNPPSPDVAPEVNRGLGLLVIHGLGGDEDSLYMQQTAHFFTARGWTVYRMNMRGVGASRHTSHGPFHAGLTADARAVMTHIAARHPEGFGAIGFSLGGQLLLRTLGEGDVPTGLRAAGTVSAPLDLSKVQARIEAPRNRLYRKYLRNGLTAQLEAADLRAPTVDFDSLNSVLEIDEKIIAPAFGFKGAEDYYSAVSALPLVPEISRPVMAVHAMDDPWITPHDYRKAPWPEGLAAGAVLTASGGHVGFRARAVEAPWYLPCLADFLKHWTVNTR